METDCLKSPKAPIKVRKRRVASEIENLGSSCIIGGLILIWMSIMTFEPGSISKLMSGLDTYRWQATQGTVVSSRLEQNDDAGRGTVTFRVMLDGRTPEITKNVSQSWLTNYEQNYAEWAAQYAAGSPITVYHNQQGWTSIGRFPETGGATSVIQVLIKLTLGLLLVSFGIYWRKRSRQKAQSASA